MGFMALASERGREMGGEIRGGVSGDGFGWGVFQGCVICMVSKFKRARKRGLILYVHKCSIS